MPPEQLWDYLIQPQYRNTLIGSDKIKIANRTNGRIAPGSVFQCYHGDKLVPQTILEWEPFESMIVKELFPMSHDVSWLDEYRLDSTEGGTRLTRTATKPAGPIFGRMLLRLLSPLFKRVSKQLEAAFAQQIEDDFRARGGALKSEFEVTEEQIREAAAAGLQASSGDQ
jgi:hypothetical protein